MLFAHWMLIETFFITQTGWGILYSGNSPSSSQEDKKNWGTVSIKVWDRDLWETSLNPVGRSHTVCKEYGKNRFVWG